MPDMREKVKEYIEELGEQVKVYENWLKGNPDASVSEEFIVKGSIATLVEVKNDLQSRLDEVI